MLLEGKSSAFKTSLYGGRVFTPPTNEKEPQRLLLSASEELEEKNNNKKVQKRRDVPAKRPQEIKKEEINLSLFPLLMNDRRTLLFVFCYFFFSEIENVFLISLHSIVHFFRTNDDLIPLAKTCTCRY